MEYKRLVSLETNFPIAFCCHLLQKKMFACLYFVMTTKGYLSEIALNGKTKGYIRSSEFVHLTPKVGQ